MNLTGLGKLLVLLNVALSLGLAALAFGIYSNRIDWPGTTPPSGGEKAEFAERKAALEEAQKAAGIALGRWEEAGAKLAHLEERRPKEQEFYVQSLQNLEGKDAAGNPVQGAIKVLATQVRGGKAELDADLVTLLGEKPPARPLQSRRALNEEIAGTLARIQTEINTVTDLVKKQQDLTQEINGIPGKQKGLRDLLAEETQVKQKALGELESLKPLRYNRQVESELLQKRQLSLQARLQELRSVGMARIQP